MNEAHAGALFAMADALQKKLDALKEHLKTVRQQRDDYLKEIQVNEAMLCQRRDDISRLGDTMEHQKAEIQKL